MAWTPQGKSREILDRAWEQQILKCIPDSHRLALEQRAASLELEPGFSKDVATFHAVRETVDRLLAFVLENMVRS